MNGIVHLDGNRLNFRKDNLMVVTLSEIRQFHKMNHEKLSPEYTKAAFLQIRLENKLKELEEGRK